MLVVLALCALVAAVVVVAVASALALDEALRKE